MLIEIIGWIGAALILGAYFLVSNKKISPTSINYQFMNLVGAVGVVINSYFHRAVPGMVLNIVWTIIAVFAILKIYFKKRS